MVGDKQGSAGERSGWMGGRKEGWSYRKKERRRYREVTGPVAYQGKTLMERCWRGQLVAELGSCGCACVH